MKASNRLSVFLFNSICTLDIIVAILTYTINPSAAFVMLFLFPINILVYFISFIVLIFEQIFKLFRLSEKVINNKGFKIYFCCSIICVIAILIWWFDSLLYSFDCLFH